MRARARVAVVFVIGACIAVAVLLVGGGRLAPLAGWDGAGIIFLTWIWFEIWRFDEHQTQRLARREDPGRVTADAMLLSASVISLAAVGEVLIDAGNHGGTTKGLLIGAGVVSVVIAWAVVHTVFTLRYARLYYGASQEGGIDFKIDGYRPRYTDFAYVAFTIGMTFQVSDTDLQAEDIRRAALRQALLSYLFGAVIIATTINLVAGLTK